MKKIYVGCALNHAPDSFIKQIETLKSRLRKDFEIVEFLGKNNGTPKQIFEHDISGVLSCDLMLAECSFPSTGLGFEIATAVQNKKIIIAIAKKDANVSPLIQGIQYKNFSFHRYETPKEVLHFLQKYI